MKLSKDVLSYFTLEENTYKGLSEKELSLICNVLLDRGIWNYPVRDFCYKFKVCIGLSGKPYIKMEYDCKEEDEILLDNIRKNDIESAVEYARSKGYRKCYDMTGEHLWLEK